MDSSLFNQREEEFVKKSVAYRSKKRNQLIRNIVLVGGAPLNEEFGAAIGADAYCRDAAVAVETAQAKIAEKRAA